MSELEQVPCRAVRQQRDLNSTCGRSRGGSSFHRQGYAVGPLPARYGLRQHGEVAYVELIVSDRKRKEIRGGPLHRPGRSPGEHKIERVDNVQHVDGTVTLGITPTAAALSC